MGNQDKRARKKQHRDDVVAQRRAELMRRRAIRVVVVGGGLAAVIVLALTSGGNEAPDKASATSTPTPLGAIACGAAAPPPADPQQYDDPPDQTLKDGVDYRAVIHTSCGDIELDLLEGVAPVTVNNFVFLAREGFYDGTTWHRIERNFVIQAGDPNGENGTEPDGPGYAIDDELPEKAGEYVYGVVAMANSGPNTGGSQFFVIVHEGSGKKGKNPLKEPAGLQPLYSIFGEVDEASFEIVDAIAKLETRGGTDPVDAVKPIATVYIESIEIIEA